MGRKGKFSARSFESLGRDFQNTKGKMQKDTSANIYESMLESEAYKDLRDRQKNLYLLCKAQYFGKRKPAADYKGLDGFDDETLFYLPWDDVWKKYGLYTEKSSKNFYDDIKALVDHGFIEIFASGKVQRTKTVYKFSSNWKTWKRENSMVAEP